MPVTTNDGPEISKPSIVLPALARPALERRERDLAQVALGGEAVAEEAVAHLAGDLGHQLADAGEEDLRASPCGFGPGLKNGVISVCV